METPECGWEPVLARLRSSRKKIGLVVTGGGAGALGHCFSRAGASKIFVEAAIPYSRRALSAYLGCPPPDACASLAAAVQLSEVARQRAHEFEDDPTDSLQTVGIALVAALPTTPTRRGQDRIHVAASTQEARPAQSRGRSWSLELAKGAHSREAAESIADAMIRHALCHLVEPPIEDTFFRDAGLQLQSANH